MWPASGPDAFFKGKNSSYPLKRGSRASLDVTGDETHPVPLAGIELLFFGRLAGNLVAVPNVTFSSAYICKCLMSFLLQHTDNILSVLAKRNTHLGV